MRSRTELTGIGVLVSVILCSAQAQRRTEFERIASYQALGGLVASAAAPGPTPGSERIYASYLYADSTLDIVGINPNNGAVEVYHNPAPGEYGARNIAVGSDGNVYFGTLPHAHFLRLDTKSRRLVDLGRPSVNEEYIWDVAFGSDYKLYGVTYPGCRLVRYDPATGRLADLGRMDPTEKYGRWIVGGHDGYLYIGIGTSKAQIAVYDTRSGEMREVLPKDAQIVGTAEPYLGVDGKVYATVGKRLFALSGFSLREIAAAGKVEEMNRDVLSDGRIVNLGEDGAMTVFDPKTSRETKLRIAYSGERLQLFRIAFGPDGVLYGSSILPLHFVKVDVAAHRVEKIAQLGGGEAYTLLAHKGRLLIGAYAGLAPLMVYNPANPLNPAAGGNPALINFTGSDEHWRPQAMIEGEDGNVYVGGTAGYGQLEGPLVAWDAPNGPALPYGDLVHNQSVVSLAAWEGNIVGGTTVEGGGGSHPTENEARVFVWSSAQKRLLWDLVPVSGAGAITDLIASKRGLIYGIATGQGQHVLFTLDPRARRIVATQTLPFHAVVYNSLASADDGSIWGLAEEGIFQIDDATHQAKLNSVSPTPISGGFALRDGAIYFLSGSDVYRYNGMGRDVH
jgi:hypothetical protein